MIKSYLQSLMCRVQPTSANRSCVPYINSILKAPFDLQTLKMYLYKYSRPFTFQCDGSTYRY